MYLSNETFNQAVTLKRQGDYKGAIRIYQQEIKKMKDSGDFHEFSTYAHAMAKCYYLNSDFYRAKSCYKAILALNVLLYPVLQGFVNRDQQFMNFASGWATHIGYVLHSWDKDYAGAIAGKGNNYDQDKYFNEGLNYIADLMIDFVDHNSTDYVKKMFFEELNKITKF